MLRPNVDEGSGLNVIFKPWQHYIPYEPTPSGLRDALDIIRQDNYQVAEAVAINAHSLVLKEHTYAHRCEQVIKSALGEKACFRLDGLIPG